MSLKIDLWVLGRLTSMVRYVDRYFDAPGRHRKPA